MNTDEDDIEKAIVVIRQCGRVSTLLLQRRLKLGYTRASLLMDELENRGIIGTSFVAGQGREVLIPVTTTEHLIQQRQRREIYREVKQLQQTALDLEKLLENADLPEMQSALHDAYGCIYHMVKLAEKMEKEAQ